MGDFTGTDRLFCADEIPDTTDRMFPEMRVNHENYLPKIGIEYSEGITGLVGGLLLQNFLDEYRLFQELIPCIWNFVLYIASIFYEWN